MMHGSTKLKFMITLTHIIIIINNNNNNNNMLGDQKGTVSSSSNRQFLELESSL